MPNISAHDNVFDGEPLFDKDVFLFIIMIFCFTLVGIFLLTLFII